MFFQLPYGIVAVSIMSATAPELTARWARGDLEAFRRRMSTGLRTMLAVIIPAAAGELILARPLVALVVGHGAAAGDTTLTAQALSMLAIGLPGFCIFLYAIRVLQSVQDLRSAFWLYALENGINIVLAVALAGHFGVRGIAFSISAAYSLAAVAALGYVRSTVSRGSGARSWAAPGPCAAGHVRPGGGGRAGQRHLGVRGHGRAPGPRGSRRGRRGRCLRARRGWPRRARTAAAHGRSRVVGGSGPGGSGPGGGGPGGGGPSGGVQGGDARGAGFAPGRAGAEDHVPARTGRRRPGAPPRPEPLPPAGRPPLRPTRLGPTRAPEPGPPHHDDPGV